MLAADLPKGGCDAGAVLVTASVVVGSITVVTVVLTGPVVVLFSPAVSPSPSSSATTTPNSRLAPASIQRWRLDSLAPCSGLCSGFGTGGKMIVGWLGSQAPQPPDLVRVTRLIRPSGV